MNNNGQSVIERLRRMQSPVEVTGRSDLDSATGTTTTTTTKDEAMSDQLSMTAVLQKMHELEMRLAAANAAAPVTAPPVQQPTFLLPGTQQPQAPQVAMPAATGVAVQIEIETASGKATAFLNYGPEWAVSSAAMKQLIGALQMANFPVKAWVPKGQRGGGW